jgi:hypothetical protein
LLRLFLGLIYQAREALEGKLVTLGAKAGDHTGSNL